MMNNTLPAWRSEHPPPLPNDTYGEWTIIEDIRLDKERTVKDRIYAQCSCGEIRNVLISNLIYGHSTSCGHTHYIKDRDEIESRKNYYPNRIGEIIHGFTLEAFSREGDDRTFTITCLNGHSHTLTKRADPKAYIQGNKFKCWCQIDDPISRMRHRKDLTLDEIGKLFGITRERVRQYEVELRNKKPLTKKRHGRSNEQMFLDDYRFERLSIAYDLSEYDQRIWINEIFHNTFYDYEKELVVVSFKKHEEF